MWSLIQNQYITESTLIFSAEGSAKKSNRRQGVVHCLPITISRMPSHKDNEWLHVILGFWAVRTVEVKTYQKIIINDDSCISVD